MQLNRIFDHLPAGRSLTDYKDRLISARIKQELSTQVARYGRVLDVALDTRQQKVRLSVALKGEPEPVQIDIGKYSLVKEEDKLWLTIDGQQIETSKEWLTLLLQDQAGRQRLPIPDKFAWLVEFLV